MQTCEMCQWTNDEKFCTAVAALHPIAVECGRWYDNGFLTNVALIFTVYSEQVGIDLIGPLPTSSRGNRFIVTLGDYFSKWPEAEAIPNKSAENGAIFCAK